MNKWQPIETAPKHDGPSFLVWCPLSMSGNVYHVFRYTNDDRFRVYASGGRLLYESPSHWMPLPDPPPKPIKSSL